MVSTLEDLAAARHLPAALIRSAERHALRPAQWQRTASGYVPITYAQLLSNIQQTAMGLIALGFKAGDRIAILMENRPEWAVADYAILSIGGVSVPLYCTYRPQDMTYVLKDSGARAVFVSGGRLLRDLIKAVHDCPEVRHVFCLEPDATSHELLRDFESLKNTSGENQLLQKRLAKLDRNTLATLVYTSGTTGAPKGVMLSHGNLLSNLEAVPDVIELCDDDLMLSFLPLAHALERMGGHFLPYSFGISVAFAERPDTVAKNMIEARPTLMIAVPRMLEVVRNRILGQIAKAPAFKRFMFDAYMKLAQQKRDASLTFFTRSVFFVLDRLVGQNIRDRFGGRLRVMVSGGAPLSVEVGQFFENLGIPVMEGYGLTEAAPLLSVNPMEDRRPGSVGKAARGVELRLAEDGEILARGSNIMLGYWHQPKASKEAVDKDGWLHTGDIGKLDADGYLYITDRKKDLIVTSGGENVAPQRIETLLTNDAQIEQAIVYGDQKPYLVALIVPAEEACRAWAEAEGLPKSDWKTLCASEIFRKAMQNRINRLLAELNPFEQIRRIHILPEPLSIESGLLTPTLKIKRRKVYERFGKILESLY